MQNNQISNILAKCWSATGVKQQLMADPTAVLKTEGVDIPAGFAIRVLENTDKLINYVLPPNPNADLSDAKLESVAGGKVTAHQGIVPIYVNGGHGFAVTTSQKSQ